MPTSSGSKKKSKRSKKSRKSSKPTVSDDIPPPPPKPEISEERRRETFDTQLDESCSVPKGPPSPVLSSLTESLGLVSLPSVLVPALYSPDDSSTPPVPPDKPVSLPKVPRKLYNDPTWHLLTKPSILHDSGTGPRVRDARAFLASSFAHPPWTEDPLCAEFAQPEMLQMLQTILPAEAAMIIWYNKSRRTSRICPVCQRLYNLGDLLPGPVTLNNGDAPASDAEKHPHSPLLLKEQMISGLCSPICFFMSSFHNAEAIRSAWGCMAEELDDNTWAALDAPAPQDDRGLNMLLKMTRLHDLGLAQLCVPDTAPDDTPPDEVFIDLRGEGLGLGSRRTSVRTVRT